MTALRIIALIAGVGVIAITGASVIGTLIVPRGLNSRFAAAVVRATLHSFRLAGDRVDDYEGKDRVLAWSAPVALLALLFSWLLALLAGYWLLEMAVHGFGPGRAFREAGSSLFTLGFASTNNKGNTAVDFLAAATGPVIIALQIAYLPTLYGAYNRRETDVTTLQSRAGEPAWGPELLARHALVDTVDALPDLFADWERWAADVSESHVNYPVLLHFRSTRPRRSWTVGLLAVLDAAALYLALCPGRPQSSARLCLRMGFSCFRDLARVEGIPFDPDPRPDRPLQLTYEEFLDAVARLEQVGFPMERGPEEAWPHFCGWRVNYEDIAYALCARLEAVPALWSGPRRQPTPEMAPVRPPNRRPDAPDGAPTPKYPPRRLEP